MKILLTLMLVSFLFGCANKNSSQSLQEIDIVIVADEKGKVRITYLEHNLLHTVYVIDKACHYDVGPSTLKKINDRIQINPNAHCSIRS
ncbi:hypothetical protein PO80_12370 [Vibrio parahaemolyticus]|uniref:hypothetical protein n=1 Tax=Vibrio parahaemolyticus TaxID=670 RepID=UPI00054441A1|nr:hypothetical protein [Vibrio parahaemolyticus]ELU8564367.1 hypothetical protein [Vibrio parahaemolyticus]KHF15205.1 hypothetical protein PO80_12370 [Vibrio parahaemolyticus]MDS1791562.1 hypothetical protein [Vibrio parahaemolyticus]OTV99011.1 hypothetical protein BA739_21380 [Vibrio parahaemolyticus]OTW03026.1 hypothetical protein BA740_21560 [Vibrio parahaemolyticus]